MIQGKINRAGILETEHISRPTLWRRFALLFRYPVGPETVWRAFPPKIASPAYHWVYGVDGKYLHRDGVFLIHRSITTKENLFWSFATSESHVALDDDLCRLSTLLTESGGTIPLGAISDWKGAIVSAVARHFGKIAHQRCLTHVTRVAERLLPERSPFDATRSLRTIAQQLHRIQSLEERSVWEWQVYVWQQWYGEMLKERTVGIRTKKKWWYTHGNLRRGFRLLTRDQNPFFVFLTNPLIPRTNNALEGVNSQLAKRLGNHRGMKTSQQVAFLFWYLTFQRIKTRSDLKRLWDIWKHEVLHRLSTR